MGDFEDIFGNNMFSTYAATKEYNYKAGARIEIMLRKKEFEKNLDNMYAIYQRGFVKQIVEYQKQIDAIKDVGLKVLRNSIGKHKIVNR